MWYRNMRPRARCDPPEFVPVLPGFLLLRTARRPCTVRPPTAALNCLTAIPPWNPCPWPALPGSPSQVGSVGGVLRRTTDNAERTTSKFFHASKTLPPFDSFTPSPHGGSLGTRRGPHDASARGARGAVPLGRPLGRLNHGQRLQDADSSTRFSISIVTAMALLWRDRELLWGVWATSVSQNGQHHVARFQVRVFARPRSSPGILASTFFFFTSVPHSGRHRGYDSVLPGGKTGIAARCGRPSSEMNVVNTRSKA